MNDKTPEQLRQQAAESDARAKESWERSDTDGFMSQWASGLTADRDRMEADLIERGSVSEFIALFDLDGNWVPAKQIDGQWGPRWMVLNEQGRSTGTFLTYMPKRASTLAKKGYTEGIVLRRAKVEMVGQNITSVGPAILPADRDWDRPVEIITTDRFKD